jgi:hypothetical protein
MSKPNVKPVILVDSAAVSSNKTKVAASPGVNWETIKRLNNKTMIK